MKAYQHDDDTTHASRARNWVVAESNPAYRYYDFRKHPQLIPEVLEDFRPFAQWPAIQKFYTMLADINGAHSQFETNDSAFNAPEPNDSPQASSKTLKVSGRVMVLFRDLVLNTRRGNLERLEEGIHTLIGPLTPDLEDGVVGTSVMRMHLPELGSDAAPASGYQLAVHFWAWGDSDAEVFENLATVIHNMHAAFIALQRRDTNE